jgi:hypothetical protein
LTESVMFINTGYVHTEPVSSAAARPYRGAAPTRIGWRAWRDLTDGNPTNYDR